MDFFYLKSGMQPQGGDDIYEGKITHRENKKL